MKALHPLQPYTTPSRELALDVACPVCGAPAGAACLYPPASQAGDHIARNGKPVPKIGVYHLRRSQRIAAILAARIVRPTPASAPSRQQLVMSFYARLDRARAPAAVLVCRRCGGADLATKVRVDRSADPVVIYAGYVCPACAASTVKRVAAVAYA